MKEKKYTGMLYNERIVDFVRWGELGYVIVLYAVLIWWLGWWGLGIAIVLDYLCHMSGGVMVDAFDHYPKEEHIHQTCSEGIEGCQTCFNEYDHAFNENYQSKLKWYEKIL